MNVSEHSKEVNLSKPAQITFLQITIAQLDAYYKLMEKSKERLRKQLILMNYLKRENKNTELSDTHNNTKLFDIYSNKGIEILNELEKVTSDMLVCSNKIKDAQLELEKIKEVQSEPEKLQ